MATKTQVDTFIKTVGEIALKESKKRKASGKKWILPGICVAQGACESAWGTSQKMINAKALFGIKVGKSKCHFGAGWKDKAYSTRTKECYDGKTYVNITDMFRAYDTIEESVEDYFDMLISCSRYCGAVNNSDARSTITAIKNGGYATSPTYINTIMSIYNSYPEIAALDAEFLGKIVAKNEYSLKDFIKDVQAACGAKVDGIAGNETLSKTVTISKTSNNKHSVVKPVQKYLDSLGYACGIADGVFGVKTEKAVKEYQSDHGCVSDGIIGTKTWKRLLH